MKYPIGIQDFEDLQRNGYSYALNQRSPAEGKGKGRVGNFNRTGRRSLPIYQLYSYSTSSQTAFIRKLM